MAPRHLVANRCAISAIRLQYIVGIGTSTYFPGRTSCLGCCRRGSWNSRSSHRHVPLRTRSTRSIAKRCGVNGQKTSRWGQISSPLRGNVAANDGSLRHLHKEDSAGVAPTTGTIPPRISRKRDTSPMSRTRERRLPLRSCRRNEATADAAVWKLRNWMPTTGRRSRSRSQRRQPSNVGAFAGASSMSERRSWLLPPVATGRTHNRLGSIVESTDRN
jgi:hypothetical protein